MKDYKNEENILWGFEDDCFDEKGNVKNKIVKEIIETEKLIFITPQDAEVLRNYKSLEQLAEEERLAKEYEELKEAEELTSLYEKLAKLGWS